MQSPEKMIEFIASLPKEQQNHLLLLLLMTTLNSLNEILTNEVSDVLYSEFQETLQAWKAEHYLQSAV